MNIKFLIITVLYLCALLVIHYQIKKYSAGKQTNTKINTNKKKEKLQLDTIISMEDIDGISADSMSVPMDLDKYFTENQTDFSFEDVPPGAVSGITNKNTEESNMPEDTIDGFDDFGASFANI